MHSVFIFSFTRYIQWPDAYNAGDFEIMVLGDSPIVEELKAMAQAKKVGDRTIKITKIKVSLRDPEVQHSVYPNITISRKSRR